VAQQVRLDEWADAKRLKEPEAENTRLKKLVAASILEIEVMREVLRNKR
jgi:putative transposase